jgi:two-component system C4-dicarboxylate transport response regulator DctD
VDDDTATLLALSETLQLRLGDVAIETAVSADTAIDRIRATAHSVIVCDVVMPRADGLILLKEAQRLRPEVPVILITAGGIDREAAALFSGAYAFLEKPLDIDHFMSVVKAALEQSDLTRRLRERNQNSIVNLQMKAIRPSRW